MSYISQHLLDKSRILTAILGFWLARDVLLVPAPGEPGSSRQDLMTPLQTISKNGVPLYLMKKLTLSLIMVIMQYQGNKGKRNTITKVSIFLTFFSTLFITGAIRIIDKRMPREQAFLIWLISWVVSLIAHLIWFYRMDKSKLRLHYNEYKIYRVVFLFIIFGGIGLYALADARGRFFH